MLFDANKITDICIKLRIDVNEFYFLYLIYSKDYDNLTKYKQGIDGWGDAFRENLSKKGLLLDHNIGNKILASKLHTTLEFDNIIEGTGIDSDLNDAYDELLDVYPFEFTMDGDPFKKYNARTGFRESNSSKYKEYILRNPNKHKEIIELTKYGKDNNLIRFGLEKYIDGRLWDSIREQREKSFGNTTSDLE